MAGGTDSSCSPAKRNRAFPTAGYPLIARPRPDGGYEIISGHRRQHAAQLARLKTLPVIVRDMSDDAAVLLMVDEAPDILPCFDESDASIHLPDTSLLLCYNPAQVLKMAGKRYLTGPVILVRTNMDGNFISLTIDDVYRFQKFLASHSVTLMADDQKLPCICIV